MVYRKIAALFGEILDLDEADMTPDLGLTPESGVEKLQLAKLVIACEKRFKITIHDEDVPDFLVLKDLADYIEEALAENKGQACERPEAERLAWFYE